MKDQFEYSSMEAYMLDRQKHGVQAFFKDMDGRPVFCKSDEESQICDFLGAAASSSAMRRTTSSIRRMRIIGSTNPISRFTLMDRTAL